MTILALNMSACYLMGDKSELEFQEMGLVTEYNDTTEEMTSYLDDSSHKSSDSQYARLQSQQQEYDSKKTSIESQLKVINAEIEGYQEAVKSNVKSECKLSISV